MRGTRPKTRPSDDGEVQLCLEPQEPTSSPVDAGSRLLWTSISVWRDRPAGAVAVPPPLRHRFPVAGCCFACSPGVVDYVYFATYGVATVTSPAASTLGTAIFLMRVAIFLPRLAGIRWCARRSARNGGAMPLTSSAGRPGFLWERWARLEITR